MIIVFLAVQYMHECSPSDKFAHLRTTYKSAQICILYTYEQKYNGRHNDALVRGIW